MNYELQGQVAVVTGAGTGIGRAIAVELASSGCEIVAVGRRLEKLEELASSLKSMGKTCTALSFDVRDYHKAPSLVEEIVGLTGKIDILVNNAGVASRENALTLTVEEWNDVMLTNLYGPFFLSREAAGKSMIPRRRGCIVNICSDLAVYGSTGGQSAYCASKGGLLQLTRNLACEWAKHGIRVNAVGPGWTLTDMTEPLFEDDAYRTAILDSIPLGRAIRPTDIANAVCFLCSEGAAAVTGQMILVDGGATAWDHVVVPY